MLTFLSQRFNHSQGLRVLMPVAAVMVLTGACVKAHSLQMVSRKQDSLSLHINTRQDYDHLDIFIYADTLTRPLEAHFRKGSERHLRLPCSRGDKIIVALADVRGEFGGLPSTVEAMEAISMSYCDEDPDAPFQSGYCSLQGALQAELALSSLLCPVKIGTLCLEDDAPLCDPVVSLRHVSAEMHILRQDGFHPTHTLDGAETLEFPLMMMRSLPFDIAAVPQRADITLYCYPNEDKEGPGGGGTELVVSGYFRGEIRNFYIPLGSIKRGDCIYIDVLLKE
ncbi:MAG: hypothetical protein IKZ71_04345 [Bacteroidales bacterium]|nr:hypothetical protein [Bacteroidales bacterium]